MIVLYKIKPSKVESVQQNWTNWPNINKCLFSSALKVFLDITSNGTRSR